MGLTQKYKQQQQQVRVHTNESNYINGMYFTDVPLAEGYSRMLLNFDIDTLSGKLIPRKGLQSLGLVHPTDNAKNYLSHDSGFNTVVQSKVCYTSDLVDRRKINKSLQSILYNTDTRAFSVATGDPDIVEDAKFDIIPFSISAAEEFVTPEPFIIAAPEIHGKHCVHNAFFKRPVGTFAFGNSFYTFLKHSKYIVQKVADLPNPNLEGFEDIVDYKTLQKKYPTGIKGQYFKFISGESKGIIAYYDNDTKLAEWPRSEEALQLEVFPDTAAYYNLCYTKLGAEIQPDEVFLDPTITYENKEDDKFYVCVIQPDKLNPTEAANWGYNMLATNPYDFTCESTAVNLVTILGILPYDKTDTSRPVLTPRKNQEITLKAFYRAPSNFHSDATNARYYATQKNDKLIDYVNTDKSVGSFKVGEWCLKDSKYYMVTYNGDLKTKKLVLFGDTQPAASERIAGLATSENGNEIRVHWQYRSAGAANWTTISNEKFTLADYYSSHGNLAPFTVTTTTPSEDTIVRLTISDPSDPVITQSGETEEAILSTMSTGLSLVSDELANTLNLSPENYDLGQATGMCEWEQRLVLWGVPGALNTIFISDVGNPTFFPYPNNVDIFTDPIISVHNYGNELLVLTTSALYRLTWDAEGTGWTHTLVQQNLHVTLEDTYMSCVIKNMFFFKSGDYYYMMVPKATSSNVRGEVAIAPISKPIERLLDNFHEEMYNLIKVVTDCPGLANFTDKLVNYFSYVDHTKVVVNYVYDLDTNTNAETVTENVENSKYLYVQLIYDTDARTWSMRAFEAAHMLYASHADAVQQNRFIDLTPSLTDEKVVLQYYQLQEHNDVSTQYVDTESQEIPVKRIMKNHQYLDTGNREINTELKKRFREFQFKIKNNTATNLGFYTSFLVDGSMRKDLQRYEPRFILDPVSGEATVIVDRVVDPNALIVFERTLDPDAKIYKTTNTEQIVVPARMLQDSGELTPTILAENNDADRWILNQSAFPGRTLCKIRMAISGKGLSPRAILLSTNEQDFEILGHSWVYRTMHGR